MVEEEDYFFDRKEQKRERKRLSSKSRSEGKKVEKKRPEGLLRGRVLSVTPQGFTVQHEEREIICTLRGTLKQERRVKKNLVTVGDFVLFEEVADNEGAIAYVEPRTSFLSRQEARTGRAEHLIAANIDQVLITVSVVTPPLKPHLVDRYIIAAKKGGMKPVIVVNKIDLLDEVERKLYEAFLEGYHAAKVPVISVSVETGEGLDELEKMMQNKASVFSGQSGVGKSSLINALTGLELATGETIAKTKKGTHTTTKASLIRLKCGGFCIDTPGIRSFGIWDLDKAEVESYYHEIFEIGRDCKFPDCSHTHETGCAVIEAVGKGEISKLRYDSYQQLLKSLEEEHFRR